MGCVESKLEELTAEKVAEALTEALKISCTKAHGRCSAEGGFSENSAIRIEIPGKIGEICDKLESVPGIGEHIKEFETLMNRAAEAAANEALNILIEAAEHLTFHDAFEILEGHEKRLAEHFIENCRDDLITKLTPIVEAKMDENGVVGVMDKIMDAYAALPFCDKPEFDLSVHIVEKCVDGLCHIIGEEEADIRSAPHQHSENIKNVFGRKKKE